MCGIGITVDAAGDGRERPWALDTMRHRGPDGEATLHAAEHGVSLEHCRLAIIDPENPEAAQPFSDPSGRWVLVYNGELFNYREIRAELERGGARFTTDSDTEVVLHAFIARGRDACAAFRGMFAFVVLDRETGELFAARDQIGVKPLLWAFVDGMFVAASELRTMLAHPAIARRLDHAGVVDYLSFGHVLGGRTLVDGVHSLAPGNVLTLRDGRVDVSEYWDLLPTDGPVAAEGARERLLELLDESVAASLVADVPISLMLSGGLDSAAIAALAARHVDPAEMTAYSVSFGLPTDESAAAKRLAGDLGMRHRELVLTEAELRGAFDVWLDSMDIPTANPTWVAISHIARAVHADGTKVLLSGDGGDELFGGYSRWMKYLQFHDRYWSRTPRALRRLGGRAARPFARGLAGDIARRAGAGGDLFVGSRPFHDNDLRRHLGPAGAAAAANHPPERFVQELRRRFDERHPGGDYLDWMSYASLKTHLVEDYLARLDKLGMQASVEGRVPLLDPVLARWAFRVPQAVKVPGYRQKALFRSAVEEILPGYITERPKQGFNAPVGAWASALLMERLDGDSPLVEEGIITPEAARDLLRGGSTGESFALWALGTLTVWAKRNL